MKTAEGTTAGLAAHGSSSLAAVSVDSYNVALRDADGFIGDRATKQVFRTILEESRERMRAVGDDPLGDTPTEDLTGKKLDKVLLKGEPEAAGIVHGAIEEFAGKLASVAGRFLKLKEWRDTQRIVVGGGLRASRTGEVAIGRAAVLLKTAGHDVEMIPVRHHPDEAGLIGGLHLAPAWIFEGHDGILAVDIGGTNLRAGIVLGRIAKAPDLSESRVAELAAWRHADDKPRPKRDEIVARLGEMLARLVRHAEKNRIQLAPFVAIGCPGTIDPSGTILRGAQNLPGNWESRRFNLADRVRTLVPAIGEHEPTVIVHNDAVVHGLSEVPFMKDVERWGVLTIGTGLGNARFTNRRAGR